MKYTSAVIAIVALLITAISATDTGPRCPFPSDELIFFPVANNCSQYWECFQGIRYLMSCPPRLHWNVEHNYCDYPGNVDCSRNNSTTTVGPTTTTTSAGTVWTPDPQCPYPSEEITFFPHPTNCSQYYECYVGNKYLMSCPSGLYWNDVVNTCDYKENVNCERAPTIPSTSSTVTTQRTTTTAPNTICVGKPDGTYLTDPEDCSRFYECVGGKALEGQCPDDLVWNEPVHTCDYPENVSCKK